MGWGVGIEEKNYKLLPSELGCYYDYVQWKLNLSPSGICKKSCNIQFNVIQVNPMFDCCLWWQVIEAGANALVAGSAVFGAKDYAEGADSQNCF